MEPFGDFRRVIVGSARFGTASGLFIRPCAMRQRANARLQPCEQPATGGLPLPGPPNPERRGALIS
jgi:hypothetical protein